MPTRRMQCTCNHVTLKKKTRPEWHVFLITEYACWNMGQPATTIAINQLSNQRDGECMHYSEVANLTLKVGF